MRARASVCVTSTSACAPADGAAARSLATSPVPLAGGRSRRWRGGGRPPRSAPASLLRTGRLALLLHSRRRSRASRTRLRQICQHRRPLPTLLRATTCRRRMRTRASFSPVWQPATGRLLLKCELGGCTTVPYQLSRRQQTARRPFLSRTHSCTRRWPAYCIASTRSRPRRHPRRLSGRLHLLSSRRLGDARHRGALGGER